MNFRDNIKALCKKRGITQKELANRLGITDISLNQTLRGDYPQLQTLEKIANALDVEVVDLFKSNNDLTALIDYNSTIYHFDSMERLKSFICGLDTSTADASNTPALRVKELLKEKKVTTYQLAEYLGVARPGVSIAMNGNPSTNWLIKVAKFLDVEVGELFSSPSGFIALIRCNGELHRFDHVNALRGFVEGINL